MIVLVIALLLSSCSSPVSPTDVEEESISAISYEHFDGEFSAEMSWGRIGVIFDGGKVRVITVTYNRHTFVENTYNLIIESNYITTYTGGYPILWYFECDYFSFEWSNNYTTLTIYDNINNRTLILHKIVP